MFRSFILVLSEKLMLWSKVKTEENIFLQLCINVWVENDVISKQITKELSWSIVIRLAIPLILQTYKLPVEVSFHTVVVEWPLRLPSNQEEKTSSSLRLAGLSSTPLGLQGIASFEKNPLHIVLINQSDNLTRLIYYCCFLRQYHSNCHLSISSLLGFCLLKPKLHLVILHPLCVGKRWNFLSIFGTVVIVIFLFYNGFL